MGTFIHATGECWTFRNPEIRQEGNYTFGLPAPMPPQHREAEPPKPAMTNGNGGAFPLRPPLNAPAR